MHNFTITKTRDYSAPILFMSQLRYSTPGTPQKIEVKTPVASATKKTTSKPAVEQKRITTITPVKNEIKKPEAKKIAEPEKKIISAETPKPIMAEKVEPAKTDIPKAIENKAEKVSDTQQKIVPAAIEQKQALPAIAQVPTNAQVSHNFREVEALRRGAQLQKELAHQWHPPIGVSPDCTCDISFFVNQQGKIENLRMVKNSGIVMFDISARQALTAMKMPQWTYGKSLIISFK